MSLNHIGCFAILSQPERWDEYDDADLHVVLEAVAAEPHLYLTSGQTCRHVEALQAYLGLDEGDE
jgi:hypothetical protein